MSPFFHRRPKRFFPPPNTNYHLTHTDFDPTTLGPNAAGPFPFIKGIAIMSGLRIDETGEGFVLRVHPSLPLSPSLSVSLSLSLVPLHLSGFERGSP